MIVKPQDCLDISFCVKGQRQWFALNGLDFRKFVREGYDSEVLLATGCQLAKDAVAQAEKRISNGG